MCFSNCKNENYHGECTKRIDSYDMDLHCFDGFKCVNCGEIFNSDIELSHRENTCVDCDSIIQDDLKQSVDITN